MLGEVIAETSGNVTGAKVLPSEGPTPKLEASTQGSGKLLGMEATVIGSYWQTIRVGGVLYGEGLFVFMTNDGGIAKFTGFGVGKPTGPGYSASWAVCGSFHTESPKLTPLNSVAVASEWDADESGNRTWVMSEWKSKSG